MGPQLEAADARDPRDEVPGDAATTEFRRRLRHHQARWRERHGHPSGTLPIAPRPGQDARPVGSNLPLAYAQRTGANFITPGALAAVRARTAIVEPHQSLDHQRLWADLLWSPALAFNLFGDVAADLDLADRAVHGLWPDAPGKVSAVKFAHSPGRLDPQWLNSLRAFDAAFILDLDDGTHGIVAVDTKYHDWLKPEVPKPENEWRTRPVAEASKAFRQGVIDRYFRRSGLCVTWLEHLLLFSMLQHPSGAWTWGRYVVVYPKDNPSVSRGLEEYRASLRDESSFGSVSLEAVLDAGALPSRAVAALRERYLVDGADG